MFGGARAFLFSFPPWGTPNPFFFIAKHVRKHDFIPFQRYYNDEAKLQFEDEEHPPYPCTHLKDENY